MQMSVGDANALAGRFISPRKSSASRRYLLAKRFPKRGARKFCRPLSKMPIGAIGAMKGRWSSPAKIAMDPSEFQKLLIVCAMYGMHGR
ncbi:hypothetical protein CEXT_565001 [Caerostris extrusa]|uniref:Uncharacterized protein n=1 Tax=Caerostris extrusa TaxID=172846 RepID=A0AAV4RL68_CAEEX|nr:hypothetical protein CEXT_565001 [Caerostris extrusa]